MTKKQFKEKCDLGHVYGRGARRINAIYYDWQDTDTGRGFKFAVASSIENGTKAELFNHLYNWVVNEVNLPYWVYNMFAKDDLNRFKVPISFGSGKWN